MSRLPSISGKRCVRALKAVGFYERRITGSHIVLRRNEPFSQVVVPDHKTLDRGTLAGIIRAAGLTHEQFIVLLKE